MRSSDYRFVAREALRGFWPITIGVTLVAALLGAGNGGMASDTVLTVQENAGFLEVGGFILILIAIAHLIIGSATELGLNLYNIKLLYRTDPPAFSTLFERFSVFGKALALRLAILLFTFLWSLLFLIPGIVASYRYALAPYLMAQYPELSVMEAIDRSKELMRGRKAELFWLRLSFFGWIMLSLFSFGVGLIFLFPYMNAAETAFYLNATEQLSYSTQ